MFLRSRLQSGVVLVLSTLLAMADLAMAQESSGFANTLTLQQAVDKALAINPAIRAAGANVDVQRAQRDFAALGRQFQVLAEVQDIFGSGPFNGFDGAETTVSINRVVEFG